MEHITQKSIHCLIISLLFMPFVSYVFFVVNFSYPARGYPGFVQHYAGQAARPLVSPFPRESR